MTTRLDFMNRIRNELGDTNTPPLWSDSLLQAYLGEALQEWSAIRPVRRQVTLTGTAGQRDFNLGVSVVPNGVISVEWPAGVLVPAGATQAQSPRSVWDISAAFSTIWFYDQSYELIENGTTGPTLRLRYPLTPENASQPLVVTYLGYYAAVQQDSDALEIVAEDETALLWFVCGRAFRWLDEQRAKRGVFAAAASNGAGASNGKNGIAANDYEQRYSNLVAARTATRGLRSQVLSPER